MAANVNLQPFFLDRSQNHTIFYIKFPEKPPTNLEQKKKH